MGDDCASGAAEQTRPGSGGPSSPLRALDQAVCPHGTGWAFELAGRRKPGGPPVPHQLGLSAELGTPPVPFPPGTAAGPAEAGPEESGGCRATSFHAWFLLRRSGTVGNTTPETATEQSILEVASRIRQSKRQQHFLPSKPTPEQLLRRAAPVPLSPKNPQPVGQSRRGRRVGAHSDHIYTDTRKRANHDVA